MRKCAAAALTLLAAVGLPAGPAAAAGANDAPPSVYLDGRLVRLPMPPVVEDGVSFVPMRRIFELEGARIEWDASRRTVTARKDGLTFTYRIGDRVAYRNAEPLPVPSPGKLVDGTTLIPLRLVSESLGHVVKWHAYDRSITISSAREYETTVAYGVNLRAAPGKDEAAGVLRLLPKGERVHVIREIDANWLEAQTEDGEIGFISAKPKYTDYTSPALADAQGDALLAFGSRFLGAPYEFGAASDQTASFDCSSFVRYVFDQVLSVDLPRVSYDQAEVGEEVSYDELRKGDLMFFSARGLPIGHVGIYAGDGKILHTYSEEKGVHFMELDDAWRKRFATARRVF